MSDPIYGGGKGENTASNVPEVITISDDDEDEQEQLADVGGPPNLETFTKKRKSGAVLSAQIFSVLEYLKSIPNYHPVSFPTLSKNTNPPIDLTHPDNDDLLDALSTNEKILITNQAYQTEQPSPHIQYKPKYTIKTLKQLIDTLDVINGSSSSNLTAASAEAGSSRAITTEEIFEACQDEEVASNLINAAICSGLVICMKSGRSATEKVFFPRGDKFLVEISGSGGFKLVKGKKSLRFESLNLGNEIEPKGSGFVGKAMESDVVNELRRGDGVIIGASTVQKLNNYMSTNLNEYQLQSCVNLCKRVSLFQPQDNQLNFTNNENSKNFDKSTKAIKVETEGKQNVDADSKTKMELDAGKKVEESKPEIRQTDITLKSNDKVDPQKTQLKIENEAIESYAHGSSGPLGQVTAAKTLEVLAGYLSQNQSPFSVSSVEKSGLEADHVATTFLYKLEPNTLPLDPPITSSDFISLKSESVNFLESVKHERKYNLNDDEELNDSENLEKIERLRVYKFGCSNDIRDIWKKVSERTCFKEEQKTSLVKELLNEGLLTQEQLKEMNEANLMGQANNQDGTINKRKRKRRTTRPVKVSNVHML